MVRKKQTGVVDDTVTENEAVNQTTKEENTTTEKTKETKVKNVKPLQDSDEIEVVSLISNVSYKDSKNLDMYEWDEVGHVEYMTFETLKNMWRNDKGYFKNMWLKPNDERVIDKFRLTNTFEKYEDLMDESLYTNKNIDKVCQMISDAPSGLKRSVFAKIKTLVVNGQINDVKVIRTLERKLGLDLVEFL